MGPWSGMDPDFWQSFKTSSGMQTISLATNQKCSVFGIYFDKDWASWEIVCNGYCDRVSRKVVTELSRHLPAPSSATSVEEAQMVSRDQFIAINLKHLCCLFKTECILFDQSLVNSIYNKQLTSDPFYAPTFSFLNTGSMLTFECRVCVHKSRDLRVQ